MAKNAQTPAGEVKARVLTPCQYGKANDVYTFASADEAAAAGSDVDTHPDAVAYAEGLAAPAAE